MAIARSGDNKERTWKLRDETQETISKHVNTKQQIELSTEVTWADLGIESQTSETLSPLPKPVPKPSDDLIAYYNLDEEDAEIAQIVQLGLAEAVAERTRTQIQREITMLAKLGYFNTAASTKNKGQRTRYLSQSKHY